MSYSSPEKRGTVSVKKRVTSLPTLLSFGVAGAFLFLLVTRFDIDWGATWDNIKGMNVGFYALALGLYYLSFLFRGIRWRILARNAGLSSFPEGRLPSVSKTSTLIIIGWFVNSVTWLRMGDAYRAYAFSEESKGSFSWSLGTILAERVLDMAIIFGLLIVSVGILSLTSDSDVSNLILVAGFLMVFVLLALLVTMRIYGIRLARYLPKRYQGAYELFHEGALGSFKQVPVVLALGLIGWALEIARLFFVIHALDMSIGIPLLIVVALGHAILSTVPTPGGVGAVEPGLTGLLVLSFARHDALSITLVDRSITYLSVIVIGGIVFLTWQVLQSRAGRQNVHRSGLTASTADQESIADG